MAVELGAGYLTLSVKYAEGMQAVVKDFNQLEKTAGKVGKKAGKNLTKEITKNLKIEKPLQDQATRAAEAHERYVEKLAKRTSKARMDEFNKAYKEQIDKLSGTKIKPKLDTGELKKDAEKAGKEVGDKFGKSAQKPIGKSIIEAVRENAKAAGIDLDKELTNAAARAGKNIGDAIGGTQIGQKVIGIFDDIAKVGEQTGIDFGQLFSDAVSGKLNTEELFRDLMSEAGPLGGIAGGDFAKSFNEILVQMPGMDEILKDFPGMAGGKGRESGELFSKAFEGVTITAMLKIVSELEGMLDNVIAKVPEKFAGLPARQMAEMAGQDVKRIGVGGPGAGGLDRLLNMIPGPQQQWRKQSEQWWKRNKPSFVPSFGFQAGGRIARRAPSGLLSGPGTGRSDSILGVGGGGVPTVRVSAGEGVVNAPAMARGGDWVVAALNAGWTPSEGLLPRPGTRGMQGGGIIQQVATFAKGESGKPYQYGGVGDPSWDCSGFMGGLWAKFVGKNPRQRHFNTESNFEALGFTSGFQPGAFNIGVSRGGGGPNSHMGGTLPNGVNVESGGSGGVQYGGAAKGAKSFPLQWSLPIPGNPRTGQSRLPGGVGGGGRGGGGGGGGRVGGGGRGGGGGGGGFAGAGAGGGGGAVGVPLVQNPNGTWTSPNPEWAKLINRESSGVADVVQGIQDVNSVTGDLATGLFQITGATWRGAGGAQYAPSAREATPQQQAIVAAEIFRQRGGAPWGSGAGQNFGRENEAALRAGLETTQDFGNTLGDTNDYLGDFDSEIQSKTSDIGDLGAAASESSAAMGDNSAVQMIGQLADIAGGGLKETLLPEGFSDPTQWPVMKSISGLMGFFGGMTNDPVAKGLLGFGSAAFGGSPSGAVSALAGIRGIGAKGYGELKPAEAGMAPEDFTAYGQAEGASLAAGFVDAAQGFMPSGPQANIDNSVHIGENGTVGQDPTQVRNEVRRDQRMNERRDLGTSRIT